MTFQAPTELRYLVVIVGGYAVDFAVSIVAFKLLGLGLVTAAVLGFTMALVANYLAHEFWTFAGRRSAGYLARFGKYVSAAMGTLLIRAVVVYLLEPFAWSDFSRVAVLAAAAGVSLIFNYLLIRFAVFS